MDRPLNVVVNGVTHLSGTRIFLARHDEVSIALKATGLAPLLWLLKVSGVDVAHLQQIADVHIFGGYESPDRLIVDLVARDMDMSVTRIPTATRHIGIAIQRHGDFRSLVFFDFDL